MSHDEDDDYTVKTRHSQELGRLSGTRILTPPKEEHDLGDWAKRVVSSLKSGPLTVKQAAFFCDVTDRSVQLAVLAAQSAHYVVAWRGKHVCLLRTPEDPKRTCPGCGAIMRSENDEEACAACMRRLNDLD
jgi:hypothetical protein